MRLRLALIALPALVAAPAFAQAPATAPATDAAAASAPATPEGAPTAVEGSLSVSSNPPGMVFIDGKPTGKTTPLVDLPLAPGTHTLKIVEQKSGRTKSVTFHIEAGGVLNLNVNLPGAEPTGTGSGTGSGTGTGTASTQPAATSQPATMADKGDKGQKGDPTVAPAEPVEDWTWMTVAGWAGLGLGSMGLVSGAVVLTTDGDDLQGPLGFALFGAGAGLILGGGVLLYLDDELSREEEPAAASLPTAMPVAFAH